MRSMLLALLAAAALTTGCATTGETTARDPWEGFNRKSFAFNEKLDQAVLKPVAQGYQKVVPGFAREGIYNFYENLEDVGTSLNNFLQGKPREGLSDAGRFLVNTVFGVFGLWDVATPMGLEKHYEDFGQTLGVWGVNSGPYLVIPLLGPSTLRDGAAKPVDPSWYYSEAFHPEHWYWAFWTLDKVRLRAALLQSEKVLDEAALDKYTFIRDAWVQRRRSQVFDGNPPRVKEEE
jgi:phospholipid-binding lipoprotein MlaA